MRNAERYPPLFPHSTIPLDTGRKLNVHKTFRRRPGRLLNFLCTFRIIHQWFSVKKGVLKNSTKFIGKHLCGSLSLNQVAGLRPATLLKKIPTQVFSCEFCEIFKNTYFVEHLQTAAFVRSIYVLCPGEYHESFSSRKQSEIYKKKRADTW